MKDKKKTLLDWWKWIWHDESWQAWLASVLVAFILIKYVLYPGVGLLFGTSLPVVAVVSGSMEHQPQNGMLCGTSADENTQWWDACGEWYQERGITQEDFSQFAFSNGFNKGDIMVVVGVDPPNLEVGDVIVYQANKQYPLIHRVVAIHEENNQLRFETKGDHNPRQIVEYALTDGTYLYACYQEQAGTIVAAPCTAGQPVTSEVPGAIAVLDETHIHPDQIIGRATTRLPWAGYVKIWFVDFLEWIGLSRVAQIF